MTANIESRVVSPEAPSGVADPVAAISLLVQSEVIAVALVERGSLRFANFGFHRLFNWPGGMDGLSILDLVEPADRKNVDNAVRDGAERHVTCAAKGIRNDGSHFGVQFRFYPVTVEGKNLSAVFAEDITHQERLSLQLRLLAYSDPLTGLANRAALVDRLRQAVLSARYATRHFAVLAIDLDHFKPVNDRLGHAAGDFALQRIAQRLLACLHDTDTVARTGGDEFAILLPLVKNREDVAAIAQRLIDEVRLPIKWAETEIELGASIGMAMFPDHASSVDRLLAAADQALYTAKERGRGRCAWAVEARISDLTPPPLVWSMAHELGVPEIDDQHRHLAELLNDLGYALRNAEPHVDILKELVRYTEFHFATEEQLMQDFGYGGTEAHTAIHRQLLNDLRGLDLSGGAVNVSLVLCFLQEWLVGHIEGADRDLANALLAHRHNAEAAASRGAGP